MVSIERLTQAVQAQADVKQVVKELRKDAREAGGKEAFWLMYAFEMAEAVKTFITEAVKSVLEPAQDFTAKVASMTHDATVAEKKSLLARRRKISDRIAICDRKLKAEAA